MRHATTHCTSPPSRSGFTLLEVMVTLVLLVVATALVTPVLIAPSSGSPSFDEVALSARSLAVRRAEPLTLQVDSAGRWAVHPSEGPVVSQGVGLAAVAGTRMTLTPFGACIVREGPASLVASWDAGRCSSGSRP